MYPLPPPYLLQSIYRIVEPCYNLVVLFAFFFSFLPPSAGPMAHAHTHTHTHTHTHMLLGVTEHSRAEKLCSIFLIYTTATAFESDIKWKCRNILPDNKKMLHNQPDIKPLTFSLTHTHTHTHARIHTHHYGHHSPMHTIHRTISLQRTAYSKQQFQVLIWTYIYNRKGFLD